MWKYFSAQFFQKWEGFNFAKENQLWLLHKPEPHVEVYLNI
jgi:hypothetical protein